MHNFRPYALSVAGFDPSGGAGILADIKTFEQHKIYGLGICTSWTHQTENKFFSVGWRSHDHIKNELVSFLNHYPIKAIKFGLIQSFTELNDLVETIHAFSPDTKIVVDPILKSSSGFDFKNISTDNLVHLLEKINLLTPNFEEMKLIANNSNVENAAKELSKHGAILLKGGHHPSGDYSDQLYTNGKVKIISSTLGTIAAKHGSGCVLSAAITANLVLGFSIEASCEKSKEYTESFLASNSTLLGYHVS